MHVAQRDLPDDVLLRVLHRAGELWPGAEFLFCPACGWTGEHGMAIMSRCPDCEVTGERKPLHIWKVARP